MTLEFGYKLEVENHILELMIEATGTVYSEMYGCDADGNRGEMRDYVDDDFEIKIFDSMGNDITDKIHKKYEWDYDKIIEESETKLIEEAVA